MNLENIFLQENKNFNEKIINIRRELHKYPELDFELPKTTKIITDFLLPLIFVFSNEFYNFFNDIFFSKPTSFCNYI